jgi:NhaA family Na+:H+ antiporter
MSQDRQETAGSDQLPAELVDRLTKPFAWFLRIEAFSGGLLLLATVIALGLSNSPWADAYSNVWELSLGIRIGSFEFARSSREWINDGLMTLFFFVVALELKRELVLGELRSPRKAAFSIAAALGGMLVPAALYLTLQLGREGVHGWGTVMATDTAFVIGCLALLGRRIPQSLRIFMLSLAIVDDIGAILVVAIGYSSQLSWGALALGAVGLTCVRGMGLVGIRSIPLYFMVGVLSWLAVDASGIHATITGVMLGLLTPTGKWVSDHRLRAILSRVVADPSGDHRTDEAERRKAWRLTEIATRETLSPVERLEMMLHPWVSLAIMPLFALANAGMPFSVGDLETPVTLAIFVGFTIGKPAGILTFGWLAVRSGLARRPLDMSWGMLAGGGFLAGIGFTMALFIADMAFPDVMINAAKLGILTASVVSAAAGLAVLACSTRGTRTVHEH